MRYLAWLERQYGSIDALNAAYHTSHASFEDMQKEDYWFSCAYPDDSLYTKDELDKHSLSVLTKQKRKMTPSPPGSVTALAQL
ncbi:MAG: hypothetical protein LUF27_00260 [Lachnospiraceae bacterium]|nr:hypothetical protein [Lachnospiraceae bacterium]